MAYYVVCYLPNSEIEDFSKRFRQKLLSLGIKDEDGHYATPSHVTLATYEVPNDQTAQFETDIARALNDFVGQATQKKSTICGYGIFANDTDDTGSVNTVLYLNLKNQKDLLGAHESYHRKASSCASYINKDFVVPAHWVPHMTLAWQLSPHEMAQATSLIYDPKFSLKNMNVTLEKISLWRVDSLHDLRAVTILNTWELPQKHT